jgi:CubicO group peptidase (beta-lactamase class C family)
MAMRLDSYPYDMAWFSNATSYTETAFASNLQSKFPVGSPVRSRWVYYNFGPAIVSAAATSITGKDWPTLMNERFFTPLGRNFC